MIHERYDGGIMRRFDHIYTFLSLCISFMKSLAPLTSMGALLSRDRVKQVSIQRMRNEVRVNLMICFVFCVLCNVCRSPWTWI